MIVFEEKVGEPSLLICPFCRKPVENSSVWCSCGANLSRYSSLPVDIKEIKSWLAENEPHYMDSSWSGGSLLELARKELISKQEEESEASNKDQAEAAEIKSLINSFLLDCKQEGLAPTIDIGRLRRERWRQWKRVPGEHRHHAPLKSFKQTPGYFIETSLAMFKDEFCITLDGDLYKHELNAPDPFPIEDFASVITIGKMAEALTTTLLWLLKTKQQPDSIEAQSTVKSGSLMASIKRKLGRGNKKNRELPEENDSSENLEEIEISAPAEVTAEVEETEELIAPDASEPAKQKRRLRLPFNIGAPDSSDKTIAPDAEIGLPVEEDFNVMTAPTVKAKRQRSSKLPFFAGAPDSDEDTNAAETDQAPLAEEDVNVMTAAIPRAKKHRRGLKLPFGMGGRASHDDQDLSYDAEAPKTESTATETGPIAATEEEAVAPSQPEPEILASQEPDQVAPVGQDTTVPVEKDNAAAETAAPKEPEPEIRVSQETDQILVSKESVASRTEEDITATIEVVPKVKKRKRGLRLPFRKGTHQHDDSWPSSKETESAKTDNREAPKTESTAAETGPIAATEEEAVAPSQPEPEILASQEPDQVAPVGQDTAAPVKEDNAAATEVAPRAKRRLGIRLPFGIGGRASRDSTSQETGKTSETDWIDGSIKETHLESELEALDGFDKEFLTMPPRDINLASKSTSDNVSEQKADRELEKTR